MTTLLPAGVKVHLAFGYIDMRKGIDGLAMLVQGVLRQDPFLCVGRNYVAARPRGAQFGGSAEPCRHIIFRSVPADAGLHPWV
jgi:transposase